MEVTNGQPPDLIASISAKLADTPIPNAQPERQPPQQAQEETPEAPVEGEPQEETQEEPQTNQTVEGEDAPEVAEIPLDQLEAIQLEVTVKGEDGKDVPEKPTIKELKEGYMRQKDYGRKTAELARQRDEVGEKVRQAIDSERTSYQASLQQLQNAFIETVAPELKDVNWNHLATNDPAEYVRLRNRADQISNVLGSIKTKQTEASQKQEAERSQTLKKVAAESRTKLEADIPGFNDELYQKIIKAGEAYGYKLEETASLVDHRAIKLLYDAYQFQNLKSTPPTEKKRVLNVPKVIKPGAAQPSRAQAQQTEAYSRFQKSGKLDDLASVIRGKL